MKLGWDGTGRSWGKRVMVKIHCIEKTLYGKDKEMQRHRKRVINQPNDVCDTKSFKC